MICKAAIDRQTKDLTILPNLPKQIQLHQLLTNSNIDTTEVFLDIEMPRMFPPRRIQERSRQT